ncbi:unnamed protein product [Microthlaspi erraticum]|uniref:F-box associated beta-propeller type 3 domain-containing protein n=1 Tax=Microthlaspi erraticum TaxID=1685480 RepID=A0A6D2HIJ0_9BRAS|nr:unnamed protein product [Microthlaspi erraticum]
MLQVPRKAGDVMTRVDKWVTQIDYGGKVTVFDFTYLKDKGEVDLWIVEDWRKKEWSMKTLVLQTCQMHLVVDIRMKPKGRILRDKVVLVPIKLVSPSAMIFEAMIYKYRIAGLASL